VAVVTGVLVPPPEPALEPLVWVTTGEDPELPEPLGEEVPLVEVVTGEELDGV